MPNHAKQQGGSKNQALPPLQGLGLSQEIAQAFAPLLDALAKGDEAILPNRMDRACRKDLQRQIRCLKDHCIGRVLAFSDCQIALNTAGKPDWEKTNEGGREWRRATACGRLSDRFVRLDTAETASQRRYRKGALTLIQSRRIRADDRKAGKSAYYEQQQSILCPSCGASLDRSANQLECPYCGAYIESDFFDWQTESFTIGTARQTPQAKLLPLALPPLLFALLFMGIAKNWYEGLLPGLFVGFLVSLAAILYIVFIKKDFAQEIVRYSENILRANLADYLRKTNER